VSERQSDQDRKRQTTTLILIDTPANIIMVRSITSTFFIVSCFQLLVGDMIIDAYAPSITPSTGNKHTKHPPTGTYPSYNKKTIILLRQQKSSHTNDDTVELVFVSPYPTTTDSTENNLNISSRRSVDEIRRAWVDKSIRYYSTVMREERRKELGQIADRRAAVPSTTETSTGATEDETTNYQIQFEKMAYKHYFALRKIKDGKPHHAERIYRRIINELLEQEQNDADELQHKCDHAKLAITTLLLALHMQRTGDSKATRSVFLNFFRIIVTSDQNDPNHQCACSAKVLQAFALFEMKQGNELKSLEIVLQAIRYDPSLTSILNWKQFRDVQARRRSRITNNQ
jgi:hypothetical protein